MSTEVIDKTAIFKRNLVVPYLAYKRIREAVLEIAKANVLPDAVVKELFDAMNEVTTDSWFEGEK